MTTPAAQAQAQALNAKMEGQARIAIDDIEKKLLRPKARQAYACTLKCYDAAGTTGDSNALEQCVQNCHQGHSQAGAYVQNEVAQYQNRLNAAMTECQAKARDVMGSSTDARKLASAEQCMLKCMEKTVNEYIGLLKPLKERIRGNLQ